jgi:hypothetical protein
VAAGEVGVTKWTLRFLVHVLIGMTIVGLAATACSSSTSSPADRRTVHSTAAPAATGSGATAASTTTGSDQSDSSEAPDSSDAPHVPDFVTDVCKIVPLDVVEKVFGAPAEAKSTQVACVFVSKADESRTIELLRAPAAVLGTQLNEGDFTPLDGLGDTFDKAYWDDSEELLVVVHGGVDYAVSASVADHGDPANKAAAIAIAKAAVDA